MTKQGTIPGSGIIEPHILYSLATFKQITGLGTYAIREARKRGLRIRYAGRKAYILGRDFHEHIDRNGRAERGQADESD